MTDSTLLAPTVVSEADVRLTAALALARVAVPVQPASMTRGVKPHVIIESPFAGASRAAAGLDQLYARAALRDSLLRGEAPMDSHMLYAQTFVLDNTDPDERELGMLAGFSWLPLVECVAVYIDRGISRDTKEVIRRATVLGVPVEERSLPAWARG